MEVFLKKIAEILEEDEVKETDELKSYPQWDSLSVLSVIAMLDANYGINLRAKEFENIQTAGDLWNLVQARKPS
jgi:acyl carrier protein